MSPVHVIVGQEPRAEQRWLEAFGGAVDVYRFDRNVDAFERLTAAEAPIDLVVLTPAQSGLFNLTPDQFIARVLEGPLASSPMLANLHVIVIGGEVTRPHPRVVSLRTLDAAIHLVKFGEVAEAPRPAPRPAAPRQEAPRMQHAPSATGSISDSVISKIWAAADAAAATTAPVHVPVERPAAPVEAPRPNASAATGVLGGGGQAAAPKLFASAAQKRTASTRMPVAGATVRPNAQPVTGGGAAANPQIAAAAASLDPELSFGGLKPARPYQLPNGAGYRGPAQRGSVIPAASHINAPNARSVPAAAPTAPVPVPVATPVAPVQQAAQPVPPALASQVRALVFNNAPSQDPVLAFSAAPAASADRLQVLAHPVPVIAPTAAQPAPIRTVPMEPPVGVYAGAPAASAAAPAQLQVSAPPVPTGGGIQADPFVQRAAREADGGVSFG